MMAAMSVSPWPVGPAPAEARKIADDDELRAIARAGVGFVIDPFNRWWHVAACRRVAAMTTGQPKWHAGTPAAREAFLGERLARYPAALPVHPCPGCAGAAAASSAVPGALSGPARGAAAPRQREPCVRRTDSGFEVWADEYVRNESRVASTAGQLRRLIAGEVRALPAPAGRLLHAGYGGGRWPGTDVENLLLNNIDQGLTLFCGPARLGIGFEDLGPAAPLAPDGTARGSYYRYRLAEPGESFTAVQPGRLICHVPEAVVPDGEARLAARVWLAVRRARPESAGPPWHGSFLLRVTLHQLEPARHVKAVVDGVTAAMQRDEADYRVNEAITRLARLQHADAAELLTLATAADAPLGARARLGPAARTRLFTLDGPGQVRVTPDDDRCIAAELTTAGTDGPARLSVEVHSAIRRPRRAAQ